MATINKLKLVAIPDILRQAFGLGKEGEVELEIEDQVAVLKPLVTQKKGKRSPKNTAKALLEIIQRLPEPQGREEMTDYASNIDKYLYGRN